MPEFQRPFLLLKRFLSYWRGLVKLLVKLYLHENSVVLAKTKHHIERKTIKDLKYQGNYVHFS